jgi:hypothetical protein
VEVILKTPERCEKREIVRTRKLMMREGIKGNTISSKW